MSNTAIFILVAILVVGGIFWLVMYSAGAGRSSDKVQASRHLILATPEKRGRPNC